MDKLNIKNKIMSKECKTARNVVSTAFIVLGIVMVMLSMSSCASSGYSSCSAYSGWNSGCGR